MHTFETSSTRFLSFPHCLTYLPNPSFLNLPLVLFRSGSRMKQEKYFSLRVVSFNEATGGGFLGFRDLKRRKGCYLRCGFLRRCKKGWDSEGDRALEAEILEFMKVSKNPEAFPSKKELVEAGRMDLVEGILREGGWLASGWDLDEEENETEDEGKAVVLGNSYGVTFEALEKGKGWSNGAARQGNGATRQGNGERRFEGSLLGLDPLPSNSSERGADDDTGIEGILTRLEKERQITFGVDLTERGSNVQVTGLMSNSGSTSLKAEETILMAQQGQGQSLHKDRLVNSHKPETWRTWSIQRAGFSDMEFEAGDITYNKLGTADTVNSPGHHSASLDAAKEDPYQEGIGHNDIKSRLQHLEFELSSVLHTLKSHPGKRMSQKGQESSSDPLLELSDSWEFQQNEIMNAQHKLRSIRAKLAVLEGKLALVTIDAQKVVDEKQKRINDARKALELLQTACVVWPNSASEVLLVGSFDGWVTQRKMEKSRTGIFSLYLKLYPGRYEIKFIVDGEWKIDPLRPIVCNNGYENNLLIVT